MHHAILLWVAALTGSGQAASPSLTPSQEPSKALIQTPIQTPIQGPIRLERVEPHMGTRFQITLFAPDPATGEKALTAGFARIAKINKILSDYDPKSETMLLCAKAGGPPVPVSPELFEITDHALALSAKTGGAFDVTVGPLTLIWRRARKSLLLPESAEIELAKTLVGSSLVKLDPTKRTIQLAKKGMRLDFGGIGKGYAADQALATLRELGITRALVAAGGDITCSDPPPGKTGWTVELIGLPGDGAAERFFSLANGAVSTSGDIEQFLEIGGRRFSHILDPKTGVGTTTRMSASVVARRGIDADSLTKVGLLLPIEKSRAIFEATPGTSARLVEPRDAADLSRGAKVTYVGDFPKLKAAPQESAAPRSGTGN